MLRLGWLLLAGWGALKLGLLTLAWLVTLGLGPINPTTMTWTAPTTNEDGTPLTDLARYLIRLAPALTGPWDDVAEVPASAAAPAPGTQEVFDLRVLGLPPGQYYAAVLALDTADNASAPSDAVPFEMVAAPGVGPTIVFGEMSAAKDPQVTILASSGTVLASVRVYLDGALVATMATNQPTWSTTLTVSRSRRAVVRVEATDAGGASQIAERVYTR